MAAVLQYGFHHYYVPISICIPQTCTAWLQCSQVIQQEVAKALLEKSLDYVDTTPTEVREVCRAWFFLPTSVDLLILVQIQHIVN